MKLMNGQPMILWQLDRLSRCQNIDNIVVATADSSANHDFAYRLREHGYATFIADDIEPNDVLGRYVSCLDHIKEFSGDTGEHYVVRVTGDCPVIDPEIIDDAILFMEDKMVDYVALMNHWPDGLDVEVISEDALKVANENASKDFEREHVTPYIYMSSDLRQDLWPCPLDLRGHNWSVDDCLDFDFISQVMELTTRKCGYNYTWRDIYGIIRMNKTWLDTATRKPRNESFMKQVGIEAPWAELRYKDISPLAAGRILEDVKDRLENDDIVE
jgi:spore coat polysaccharide biosynthesis protein SpsF (cytidylyltransferase family)